jgi:MFS family permease
MHVVKTFLRWTYLRAVFHRGYVLTSGLYFGVDAHLSASQIVLLGTVVSATLALADIPTGVWADAIGRKWPLVIGHLFLAAGMVMTGLVTAFPLILVTQVLWGSGWAFLTGADVAWITDELDQPQRIARVLTTSARRDLAGGATGMVVFGVLGWATSLATAIVVSGASMAALGLFVAARFTERDFRPTREQRWSASLSIFRLGVSLARRDHEFLQVFVATMLINGAALVGWLFPRQLVNLGFPSDPVLWYTAFGICSSAAGFVALRIVEARLDGVGVARRVYALTCFIGMLGLVVLAVAPDALIGGAGVLLVSGIAFNVTRTVSVIWVNRRTTSDVRATVHSFLD